MTAKDRLRASLAEVPRRERLLVGAAMAAALLLVLAYIAARYGHPLVGDQIEYDRQGRFFADGMAWWTTTPFGIPHPTAWKSPGYPLWVGIWYTLLGDSPTLVAVVQAFLAPVTVLLTWLLARRLFGPTVAILAAWMTAVFPLVWEWNGLLYSEALAVPLTVGAMLLFLGREEVTPRLAIAVGAVIGVAMLVRPSSVFLYAGVLAAFAVATGLKRGVALTALSVGVAALLIAPWTIRNYVEFDALLPLSVQDGAIAGTFNAESANDPQWPYAWRAEPRGVRQVFRPRNAVDDAELLRKLRTLGFDYIRENPSSVPKAFFWNGITRFWDLRRPARAVDEVAFEGRSKPVTQVGLAMYYLLLPLALFGLWKVRSRRDVVIPVLVLAIASSLVFTVVSGTRYRAPIEPLIVTFACAALVPLLRRSREPAEVYAPAPSSASSARAASVPSRTL